MKIMCHRCRNPDVIGVQTPESNDLISLFLQHLAGNVFKQPDFIASESKIDKIISFHIQLSLPDLIIQFLQRSLIMN